MCGVHYLETRGQLLSLVMVFFSFPFPKPSMELSRELRSLLGLWGSAWGRGWGGAAVGGGASVGINKFIIMLLKWSLSLLPSPTSWWLTWWCSFWFSSCRGGGGGGGGGCSRWSALYSCDCRRLWECCIVWCVHVCCVYCEDKHNHGNLMSQHHFVRLC